ncbi:hypothetical protein QFC21_003771 [Naganishia friedmannii]|uniref:Uncharacterized protein n=1 Tax=Naganishia friedmannii TaxID=89922 RepID=A0ACC2VK43_9TREE|nr:hypothetical protein QFC21_003771 [Naganishia friedmannii]
MLRATLLPALLGAIAAASPVPTALNQRTSFLQPKRDGGFTFPSADVYRTRAQSAVNLGFWLVGERYGLEMHYAECNTDSSHNDELVLARQCTKEQKENFWNTFMTEWDFATMATMGINTARLPAIDWAAQHNIGILLDFHGAEGSQNGWEHSGDDSQPATFLDDPEHLEHTTQVLEWIAWQIKDKDNVVGLELLNEPNPDDHSRIDAWYDSTLVRLRTILGNDYPFYISGSMFDQARINWVKQQSGFVVLDYHMDKNAQDQVSMMWDEYYGAFDNAASVNLITDDWLSEWSFLSSTKGTDGLSKIGTGDRALLVPVNGQKSFWPDGTSIGVHRNWNSKRNAYEAEAPNSVHIWDEGCKVARAFSESGTR